MEYNKGQRLEGLRHATSEAGMRPWPVGLESKNLEFLVFHREATVRF